MTLCVHTGKQCDCQPQDGVMCPSGPQPPWRPWPAESKPSATSRENPHRDGLDMDEIYRSRQDLVGGGGRS